MTLEEQVLVEVVRLLETLGVPYMIVGSVASSHHGRPRATHDADLVIDPTPPALEALIRHLADSGFYVDATGAREALAARGQFNIVDVETASKLDLIIRKERPFSREEFRRRSEAELTEGVRVPLATPEDTILSKLEWARKSGEPEKQLRDVAGIVDVQPNLDRTYVTRWSEELGVLDLWDLVLEGRP